MQGSAPRTGAAVRYGFYPLADLSRPALFVWNTHDGLVPAAFGRHVSRWLPHAEQITIQSCGHVPQVERRAPRGIGNPAFNWPRGG